MASLINALSFGTPMALLGLLALPVIWWLLRFTPPKPKAVAFPPIRILLGLPSQEETPDKTPWWLMALRLLLATLLVLAVSQPFLQPKGTRLLPQGPRLVLVDNGWAAAQNWAERQKVLSAILEQARVDGAPVTLVSTAAQASAIDPKPVSASDALNAARLMKPSPLPTQRNEIIDKLKAAGIKDAASVIWIADGVDAGSAESFTKGIKALLPGADMRIFGVDTASLPLALSTFRVEGNEVKLNVLRPQASPATAANISVRATNGRTLLDTPVELGTGTASAISFSLPTALRNEIQTIAIDGQENAAARQLFDDRWRKRTIALEANETSEQAQPLLSPLHYLRRGLEPFAELREPGNAAELKALMDSGLSALVLADVGEIPQSTQDVLIPWIEQGGLLIRFAGPRLAAAHDNLLPVLLREGDRTLGSALSWDVPQGLQPFPETSPFAGLAVDPAIKVTRQVLAEPDPEVANRTWASLDDGTPLVTAAKRGKGIIVLFHVTANASWSNLPLSGLFIEMLQRVAGLDPASAAPDGSGKDSDFVPRLMLSGNGELITPDGTAQPIAAQNMDKAKISAFNPPGLYVRQGRERALNLDLSAADVAAMPGTLDGVSVETFAEQPRTDFAPWLFAGAALLFFLDCIAAIMLGGGFRRRPQVAAMLALATGLFFMPASFDGFSKARAETPVSDKDMQAALSPRLAYVLTGDSEIDRISKEGLTGLTAYLTDRTSANLAEPAGVDVSKDEVVFYPLLYWPVKAEAAALDDATSAKIADYMKNGGTILFDTRDGGLEDQSPALKALLEKLDLPPLEPVPDNHVLTRSFYLLQDFPGRYEGPRPWVEAAANGETTDPGTADGVSGVIIGSNDYAAAWAVNDSGEPLYAVVPGSERQREFAIRSGINIVMYALTGNYKADQVHVPALLERLGQ